MNEIRLKETLRLDLLRQAHLFGVESPGKGFKFWLGVFSPRFVPVLIYRISFKFQSSGWSLPARLFSMLNVVLFGIEIATACHIGPGLFFPHTHGTVIGAVSIGKNAVIYQGVTLGAKDLDFTYDQRHRPTVGNNVLIGAGAKILGGISIGDNVKVAANAVVLNSVVDGAIVAGIPAKIVESKDPVHV